MPAILQIVAAVGSTTALLDLNDNPAGILVRRDGSGGGGGLGLADVQSADADMPSWSGGGGGTIPEAMSRTITVPVHLMGATPDAVGAKVTSLARLVAQPWVLRVRRSGASADGWVRCYPTVPQIETNITGPDQARGAASGVVVASTEPYAYGARVDKAPATVPLVNSSTANAFVLDVTSVTGDAPTPAFIRCNDTALTGAAHGTLFAVRRTGTPTSLTGWSTSATSGTTSVVGGGATASALSGDAGLSGGTGVRFAYTAAYNPLNGASAARLTYTPALTGAEAPGLYKLLARVRRSTTDEFTFWPKVAGIYALDSVLYPAGGGNTRVIDLGVIQLPSGQPQQIAAPSGVVIGAEPPQILVEVWKTTGLGTTAANLDIDYLLLIPCDEDAGVVFQSAASSGSYLTVDGYAQDAYLTTGDPLAAGATGTSGAVRLDYVGGVPRLYPGVTNRLFIVGGFSAVTAPALAQAAALTVSYWPRYTWLP